MKNIFKFIIVVPIICSFFIAMIFLAIGVYETVVGVGEILTGQIHTDAAPGVKLLEALDIFLIGFLFLIFSIGFSQLFFPKPSRIFNVLEIITPNWLKVDNFTQLKLILWDTVLTTLVVIFIGDAYRKKGEYNWELLLIPIAILLISLSRFLLKAVKKA